MKTVIGAGLIGLLFVGPAYADDLIPSWVTKEKLAGLKTIGIDTESDLQAKGNYHWRFRARKASAIPTRRGRPPNPLKGSILVNWNNVTSSEKALFSELDRKIDELDKKIDKKINELDKKIDNLKFVAVMLCIFVGLIVWKLAK